MTTNSYVNLPLVNAEELQNVLVSPTNPIDGYVLEYVAADDEWEAKKITASSTTSVTMGGDVINNSTTSTVVKIQGVSVSSTAPTDGYVLEYSASSTQWQPTKLPTIPTSFTVGGDLSGTTNSATVNKINGNAVKQQTLSSTNDGYILTWVNANSNWESKTASISFTVGGDLGGSNTNQIVKSITGASDVVNIASDTLIFANGLTAPILCQNATGSVAAPLTIAAQTSITGPGGNLILQSGQGGIGGQPNGQVLLKNAGNTVASLTSNKLYLDVGINYKTIATSISYQVLLTDRTIICSNTSAPITITLPSTMTEGDEYVVIDGIGSAATYNITVNGNGATINGSSTYVINANFASITIISDGANWHAQICQAATTPTTTVSMGGDISGSSNASTVNKIQGVSVSSTAPTDGYVLEYSASSTQWRPTKLPITYTLSGDVTGNSSSSTVIAIQGNKVKPATYGSSQDGYVLYWNNTDGYIETKAVSSGSSVTWANDLAGSTATNQYVAAISGNAGAGGVIPINGTTTNLQIASNNTTCSSSCNIKRNKNIG